MFPHGIFRITAAAPPVSIANPAANAEASIQVIDETDADLVLLPELGLTGYTCGDLFASDSLLSGAIDALEQIAEHSGSHRKIVVVGLPLSVAGSLMNCAAVVNGGRVVGIIPKTFLPTYREFYEGRHFRGAGISEPELVTVHGEDIAFGIDLLFGCGEATIGIEICEDLWAPQQPAMQHVLQGAEIILNLSASNELVAKADYRRELISMTSARGICGYLYASSGPLESSKDVVFGGHLLAAENGQSLGEKSR